MNRWIIAVSLAWASSAAPAEIFKCENKATGEIEFKDSPCTVEQAEQALPETLGDAPSLEGGEERAALAAIMNEDRARFQAVCEEQLDRETLTDSQFKRRCESALQNQAECKIQASRMFPEKVYTAYIAGLAEGMSQEAASSRAKVRENWGGVSSEQAMVMAQPAADFTSECIQTIFD